MSRSQGAPTIGALRRTQLARLLNLILVLRSGGVRNARQLAEICEVSRRTIFRDLETLALAGVPVRYCPDRQGYQVAAHYAFVAPRLEEPEVLALVAMASRLPQDAFDLGRAARSGALKLLQAVSDDCRRQALAFAETIPEPAQQPCLPAERRAVYDAIRQAIAAARQVRLWYRDQGRPAHEVTKVSPYRLAWSRDHWSLVGRSTLHRRVHLFQIPWIVRAVVTEDPYTVPPRYQLDPDPSVARAPGQGGAGTRSGSSSARPSHP